MLGLTSEKKSSYLDPEDYYEQLDHMRAALKDMARSFGKVASKRGSEARSYALTTAEDAEEMMKDHLAASMLLALGVGVAVGFFLLRSSK